MKNNTNIALILCGQAGQGIQTVERLLIHTFCACGYHVFATKEYMSRVRGGMNSTLIRVADQPVSAFIERVDWLIALNQGAVTHLRTRITPTTVMIGDKNQCQSELNPTDTFFDIPFAAMASELGSPVYANTVAVGAILGVLRIPLVTGLDVVRQYFHGKSDEIIEKNLQAVRRGYESTIRFQASTQTLPAGETKLKNHIILNGAEAISLGAISGGCNFISSYPMSPSTPVLTFMAEQGRKFNILVEQAEDEIAAINMAIGAWYAGARAMVTTSGGGFDLMTEGLSLAAMIESPLVIHLGQRPGPATGLPTRTEQADLELAIYSGHGEFPRIILAPGTLQEAFDLTSKAFDLAAEFQVPVFILTDQYFIDSYYNTPAFDLKNNQLNNHIIETAEDYTRYQFTPDGISPRGIPGFGRGYVCADSDEHDVQGHITEDLDLRIRMMNKRLGKLELLKKQAISPSYFGPENSPNLIVCWGSTLPIVLEAVSFLARDDVAVLHFSQVYPLSETLGECLTMTKNSIIVENNATGQFARLLKIYANIDVRHRILKYDGLPFAADRLAETLKNVLI